MELNDARPIKPDKIIIPKKNSFDLFSKDFQKSINTVDSRNTTDKKTINDNNIVKEIQKKPKTSIIVNQNNFNVINPNPTPVEFYYEFKDYIKGGKLPKQSNNSSENKDKDKEKNNSNKKLDQYLQKVKYYMFLKNQHLNELKNKVRFEQSVKDEEKNLNKNVNKSAILICPKNRKPLYQYHNINDESLSKDFDLFYKYHQKERKINKNKLYKKKNNIKDFSNNSFDKNNNYKQFLKFYENKMNWTKRRDNKIKNKKTMKEEKDKQIINSFSFKPTIDKKSLQIINKRNNFIDFMENKPITDRNYTIINKKEIYQKYCAKIRPYISFYYENHSPFYKNNKSNNSLSLTKRKSSVDIGMIHINKGKNIKIIKEKKDNNITGNNSKEKKEKELSLQGNKKNIFNMFKPEKKEIQKRLNNYTNRNRNNNKSQKDIKNNSKSKIKKKIWWNENFNNNKEKSYDWNDLYKVNVRDNCSWNKACLNKIISKPKDNKLINDLI